MANSVKNVVFFIFKIVSGFMRRVLACHRCFTLDTDSSVMEDAVRLNFWRKSAVKIFIGGFTFRTPVCDKSSEVLFFSWGDIWAFSFTAQSISELFNIIVILPCNSLIPGKSLSKKLCLYLLSNSNYTHILSSSRVRLISSVTVSIRSIALARAGNSNFKSFILMQELSIDALLLEHVF